MFILLFAPLIFFLNAYLLAVTALSYVAESVSFGQQMNSVNWLECSTELSFAFMKRD